MSTIQFAHNFKLENPHDIQRYFPLNKNNLEERVKSVLQRLLHFLEKGVWINEKALCAWIEANAGTTVSPLLEGRAVQRKLVRKENKMELSKPNLAKKMKEILSFISEFFKHPTMVGAVLPSSAALAKEIVSELAKDLTARPRTILEVGPGTGNFTDKIIKRMNPGDQLHLVEFDKAFADQLRCKYDHIENVTVYHCSILDFAPNRIRYDCIISGLPLNAFQADFVTQVFAKFRMLAKRNATLSYFEYLVVPKVKRLICSPQEKKNLDDVLQIKKSFYHRFKLRKANVLLNVPAARVRHHQL